MPSLPPVVGNVNRRSCAYCYMDIDIDHHRSKLATAAAFVNATDARYSLSTKDLRGLGGSELSRLKELIACDQEWATKNRECGGIELRPPPQGNRIVFQLFWDVAPLACENFATLCTNGGSSISDGSVGVGESKKAKNGSKPAPIGESGKPLTYRASMIHRVVPGFVLQGGDFVFGNGSGGESIYNGKKFKDEQAGLELKHDRKGFLSMGNSGKKHSNTSQFFVTLDAAPQCNGKHVVFGKVSSGFEVLEAAAAFGSSSAEGGEPTVPIVITDCGAFTPWETPSAGYWFDQPDTESYSGVSPVFIHRPRLAVVAPTNAVLDKFRTAVKDFAVVTTPILTSKDDCQQGNMDDDNLVRETIEGLLEAFTVDVVLVAPACKNYVTDLTAPKQSERSSPLSVAELVIEAKPMDALMLIRNKSWLGKKSGWQLDGAQTS